MLFALALPDNATPGDLAGEIVATAGGGTERRVPVRVRVGGPTLAALTVEDVEVSGGTVRYALVNRGNTPLRPRLAVRADGLFGVVLDRPERPLPLELTPGHRVELTEPWPDAPALDSVTVRLRVTAEGGARGEGWPRRRTSRWRRSPGAGCWRSARWRCSARGRTDGAAPEASPKSPLCPRPPPSRLPPWSLKTADRPATPAPSRGQERNREAAAPRDRAPARRTATATLLLLLAVLPPLVTAPGAAATVRAAESDPAVTLSKKEAGKGGEITVKGTGWRPEALLMLLICGRSSPERGVIGGTNSCANADGRAVTTDRKGRSARSCRWPSRPNPAPVWCTWPR